MNKFSNADKNDNQDRSAQSPLDGEGCQVCRSN